MRIHHLALRTADLTALERFYANVLGVPVMRRNHQHSVWLDAGGAIVMLERREDGEPAIEPESKELICFGIAPGERDAMRDRLAAAGIPLEAETAYTLYFRDPDGRRVGVSSFPDELRAPV